MKARRLPSAAMNSSHSTRLLSTSTIHKKGVLNTPLSQFNHTEKLSEGRYVQSEEEGKRHVVIVARSSDDSTRDERPYEC